MNKEILQADISAAFTPDGLDQGFDPAGEKETSGRSNELFCPLCLAVLRAIEREGIEIDVCPQCGGVWLDRGELDQIIARAFMALLDIRADATSAKQTVHKA